MVKILALVLWVACVVTLLIELSPVLVPVMFILIGVSGLKRLVR
jgi:hypothetical protein